MVNENFAHGRSRLPSQADSSAYQPRPNPKWRALRIGDTVKPNFPDRAVLAEHPRGKIMAVRGDLARVRWEDRSEEEVSLRVLVKA